MAKRIFPAKLLHDRCLHLAQSRRDDLTADEFTALNVVAQAWAAMLSVTPAEYQAALAALDKYHA